MTTVVACDYSFAGPTVQDLQSSKPEGEGQWHACCQMLIQGEHTGGAGIMSVNSRSLVVGLRFGNINAQQARSLLALMGWF